MSILKLRQSGRTTRMIAEAKKLADAGRAVYVITSSERYRRELAVVANDDRIKFETELSVGNLDWFDIKLRRAHPNCVVLIDHYAIEKKLSKLLEMLHRYD